MTTEAPAAPGVAFQYGGKDFFLSRVCQDDKSQLMAMGNSQLLADVRAMAPFQSPEQNAADYDAAMRRVGARALWWDEQDGVAYRWSRSGFVALCWLCLRRHSPTLKLADVEVMFDHDGGKMLLAHYQVANADPTAPQPSGDASGDGSTLG